MEPNIRSQIEKHKRCTYMHIAHSIDDERLYFDTIYSIYVHLKHGRTHIHCTYIETVPFSTSINHHSLIGYKQCHFNEDQPN